MSTLVPANSAPFTATWDVTAAPCIETLPWLIRPRPIPKGSATRSIGPLSVINSRAEMFAGIGAASVPISKRPTLETTIVSTRSSLLAVVEKESVPSTRTRANPRRDHTVDRHFDADRDEHTRAIARNDPVVPSIRIRPGTTGNSVVSHLAVANELKQRQMLALQHRIGSMGNQRVNRFGGLAVAQLVERINQRKTFELRRGSRITAPG